MAREFWSPGGRGLASSLGARHCDWPEAVYILAMSLFTFLLNLLWIVFGGLEMAIGWVIAAVIMAITITSGFPGRARRSISPPTRCCRLGKGNADDSHREYDRGDSHLKLAGIALWPIGKETVAADALPFSHSAQR